MSATLNQIPDVVESVFPPVVISLPSGRFAVYGDAGWFPVSANFKQEDAIKRWKPRLSRTTNNQVPTNKQQWEVQSSRGKSMYKVTKNEVGSWSCSCKGWIFHQTKDCKHIKQIKVQEGL